MVSKNSPLKLRYQANKRVKLQKAQTDAFLKLLDKKYPKVLEVGCGKGYFSYVGALHHKFINCYGCDTFPDYQIKEIRSYVDSVVFKKIENNVLPFADNSFDLVFSMDVIEHVENDIKFIKENIRVCRKGGEIIIGTPNYWRIANIFLLICGQLKFPKNLGKTDYGNCIHIREYKIKDLVKKIIKSAGGKISKNEIKVYPCWFGILPLNFGFENFPYFLNNIAHFVFIKFNKTW